MDFNLGNEKIRSALVAEKVPIFTLNTDFIARNAKFGSARVADEV